jgi:predicted nucleic acid-binding protein
MAADLGAVGKIAWEHGKPVRLIYLDTVIAIYAVEGSPAFQARALTRMMGLRGGGDIAAVSDLTWLECHIKPIRLNDAIALANYQSFLTAANVVRVGLPTAVFERATLIRAHYNYRLADALHLAAAVEAGCDAFLTNDLRLRAFTDISVEVLP